MYTCHVESRDYCNWNYSPPDSNIECPLVHKLFKLDQNFVYKLFLATQTFYIKYIFALVISSQVNILVGFNHNLNFYLNLNENPL